MIASDFRDRHRFPLWLALYESPWSPGSSPGQVQLDVGEVLLKPEAEAEQRERQFPRQTWQC